jgi:hypothetical protein
MFDDSRADAYYLVGCRRFALTDRVGLERLMSELEAADSKLSEWLADFDAHYRASKRFQHPDLPDDRRAQFKAEIERLLPIVERQPALPVSITSCLSECGRRNLKVSHPIPIKDLRAELQAIYKDANNALVEMSLRGSVDPPASTVLFRRPDEDAERDRDSGKAAQSTNDRVAAILAKDPDAESPKIGRMLGGIPKQTIRGTSAWQNRPGAAKAKTKKPKKSIPVIPLSPEMIAVRASNMMSPLEIAMRREEEEELDPRALIEREYMETVVDAKKAKFFKMSKGEQDSELMSWKASQMTNGMP